MASDRMIITLDRVAFVTLMVSIGPLSSAAWSGLSNGHPNQPYSCFQQLVKFCISKMVAPKLRLLRSVILVVYLVTALVRSQTSTVPQQPPMASNILAYLLVGDAITNVYDYIRTNNMSLALNVNDEALLLKLGAADLAKINLKSESDRHRLHMVTQIMFTLHRNKQTIDGGPSVDLVTSLESCQSISPQNATWEKICYDQQSQAKDSLESIVKITRHDACGLAVRRKWLSSAARVGNLVLFKHLWSQVEGSPLVHTEFIAYLQEACIGNSVPLSRFLLARHKELFSAEQPQRPGMINIVLNLAAEYDNVELMEHFWKVYPNPTSLLPYLHRSACECGSLKVVRYLESKCKNILSLEEPILLAVRNGNVSIVQHYLSTATQPPAAFNESFFQRAIELSSAFGHLNVLEFLTSRKGNAFVWPIGNDNDVFNRIMLMGALVGRLEVMNYALGSGKDGNLRFSSVTVSDKVVVNGVMNGRLEIIQFLVSKVVSMDRRFETLNFATLNNLPLRLACEHGDLSIVKYFAAMKSQSKIFEKVSATALNYDALVQAFIFGREAVYTYLLESPTNLMPLRPDGPVFQKGMQRALTEASALGKIASVKYIVTNHLTAIDGGDDDETALMKAVQNNREQVVEYLLQNDARVSLDMIVEAGLYSSEAILSRLMAAVSPETIQREFEQKLATAASPWMTRLRSMFRWNRATKVQTALDILRRKEILSKFLKSKYGETPSSHLLDEVVDAISDSNVDLQATVSKLARLPSLQNWERSVSKRLDQKLLAGAALSAVLIVGCVAIMFASSEGVLNTAVIDPSPPSPPPSTNQSIWTLDTQSNASCPIIQPPHLDVDFNISNSSAVSISSTLVSDTGPTEPSTLPVFVLSGNSSELNCTTEPKSVSNPIYNPFGWKSENFDESKYFWSLQASNYESDRRWEGNPQCAIDSYPGTEQLPVVPAIVQKVESVPNVDGFDTHNRKVETHLQHVPIGEDTIDGENTWTSVLIEPLGRTSPASSINETMGDPDCLKPCGYPFEPWTPIVESSPEGPGFSPAEIVTELDAHATLMETPVGGNLVLDSSRPPEMDDQIKVPYLPQADTNLETVADVDVDASSNVSPVGNSDSPTAIPTLTNVDASVPSASQRFFQAIGTGIVGWATWWWYNYGMVLIFYWY